jgi:metal-sulfur cluster biosynthetic enzyme
VSGTFTRDRVEAGVRAALASVMDPELDQSLVRLGFASAEVEDGGRVRIELRLPTFWCAPNFAYLMADDARAAVEAVDGVREVEVRLQDHFADGEVTSGVSSGRSFDEAFAGLADGGGLEELRHLFWAKSLVVRQERLLRALLAEGRSLADVAAMRLGDVAPRPELEPYLQARRRLGLPQRLDAPLAVMPGGRPVRASELESHLHRARTTRVTMEVNTSLCRGLLETRYPTRSGGGHG